jgi:hypothetical protein
MGEASAHGANIRIIDRASAPATFGAASLRRGWRNSAGLAIEALDLGPILRPDRTCVRRPAGVAVLHSQPVSLPCNDLSRDGVGRSVIQDAYLEATLSVVTILAWIAATTEAMDLVLERYSWRLNGPTPPPLHHPLAA